MPGAVYILTNKNNTVLYTGATTDLLRRMHEHRDRKSIRGFSAQYNVTKLVYYEIFPDMLAAQAREKQLKGGSRQKKLNLINAVNPDWDDLFEQLSDQQA